jgi:glutathione synthase/RimK-type ligase-like ATP-grasp enzyme
MKYSFIFYILYLYIILYVISLMCMSHMNYKMYIWTLYNYKYFIWLYSKNFSTTRKMYIFQVIIYSILFPFFFPIIATFIPQYDLLFGLGGEFFVFPISLHRDKKNITKKVQSKLFWYYIFKENNILTPEVYYYFNNKKKKLTLINNISSLKNDIFIIKPNYGTEGSNIIKETITTFKNMLSYTKQDLLLQEYIEDCYNDTARHFRINTLSNNNEVVIFSIFEYKQFDKNKLASNGANGGIATFCGPVNCGFLSKEEQQYIITICDSLKKLHKKEFDILPFIGWDVCLTCNGPYVFEGNLGSAMKRDMNMYTKYISILSDMYSKYK